MGDMNLKLCPFCKSKVEIHEYINKTIVYCSNDLCKIWMEEMTPDEWNHRPIEDDLREQIEGQKIFHIKELERLTKKLSKCIEAFIK